MPPGELRSTRRCRELPGLPVASSSTWSRPGASRIHSPPPHRLPPPPAPNSSTPESSSERAAVADVATFLLSHCHLAQDARRRRLHRRVQAIEARSLEHVAIFINASPEPPHDFADFFAAVTPQPAP